MKKMKYTFVLSLVLLLSACSFGEKTEKKLSDILAEIYTAESDYRDVQPELVEAEKKEQANFQSMMELTKDQQDELTTHVDETVKLLEERVVLVEKEAASIKSASEKMKQMDTLISETKDKTEQENLEKIKEALKNRYEAYEVLTEQYKTLTNTQNELYHLLVEEDGDVNTVQEKVVEVNEQSETVKKAVEKFNDLTLQLNQVKDEVFNSLQADNK